MSTNSPQVIFAGTGSFAVPSLLTLQNTATVAVVVSQAITSPVGTVATKLGLKVLTPERIGTITQELSHYRADLLIVADYGQIIPASILNLPRYGCLNIHPSLLPHHRGPSPIPATILSGESTTGVTIIAMDSEMDHGPIVAQTLYHLTGQETAENLEKILATIGAELLVQIIPGYLKGEIKKIEQNHTQATYCHILQRSDGKLIWEDSPEDIHRKVRAYQPWPGVWCILPLHNKVKIVKLLNVQPWTSGKDDISKLKTGQFFWQHALGLKLLSGALTIIELQVAGGRKLSGEEFYRGYHSSVQIYPK